LPARVRALLDADAAALANARAWPWWYYAAAVTVGLAGLSGWRRRCQRVARRAMLVRALATVAERLRVGNDEATEAFAAFCAACIGGGPFAAEHGWQQLAAAGVPADLVARARAMHEALGSARYGGVRPADDDVLGLLREIVPWCGG